MAGQQRPVGGHNGQNSQGAVKANRNRHLRTPTSAGRVRRQVSSSPRGSCCIRRRWIQMPAKTGTGRPNMTTGGARRSLMQQAGWSRVSAGCLPEPGIEAAQHPGIPRGSGSRSPARQGASQW